MGKVYEAIDARVRAFAERLLTPNMERRGVDGIVQYRRDKNRVSIDGLSAFDDDPL